MQAYGFSNSFIAGEICAAAWDRVELQEITKGCEVAQNYVVTVQGPLRKRRGFWLNGSVANPANLGRLIPFRRSVNDALMLEFGNLTCRVWQANGQPLMNGLSQVSFATPYTSAQLAGLRYKQVADVIYFRHNTGLQPQALTRTSDTSWAFNPESFPNGPWLNENTNTAISITLSGGSPVADANTHSGASYIAIGSTVSLAASGANLFNANQVGSYVRLRQLPGQGAGILSWSAGYEQQTGMFCISVGNIYVNTRTTGVGGPTQNNLATNPPVHTQGSASDGLNMWQYIGDGAGIVEITSVTGPTSATGTVMAAIPFGDTSTTYWAFSAYSNDQGWPRMWPSLREERLVNGATAQSLDMLDTTRTAGFYPDHEDYHPGQGTGNVIATDAIRRRIGDDFGELLWSITAGYLIVGSVAGEYLVAGSVLDEPLSPAGIVIKELSHFGSADVGPVKAHKSVLYVQRAGQTLRELMVDTSQQATTNELTVFAAHLTQPQPEEQRSYSARAFSQLAWVLPPDETLFARMSDGGMTCMVYHQEQQVRGWCSMTLPAGWICEDEVTLPGPGGFETLWCIWSNATTGQRLIVMQSQLADDLFLDIAQAYSGAPVSTITGLTAFAGQTVSVVANGADMGDQTVSVGGTVSVPAGTTSAQIGFRYTAFFRSLKLNPLGAGLSLNMRKAVTTALVDLKTVEAKVGLDGCSLTETVKTRTPADIPAPIPRRKVCEVTLAGDGGQDGRDPRIVISDSTAFDGWIYSIQPMEAVGA